MTVTKRTRFEVLRRDQHSCQYCGAKAPDVTLQIDHVVPVALGGDDKPSNLVTACKDCNSGKSSIPPDAPLVQSLSDRAAAYALGMIDKMTRFRADIDALDSYTAGFLSIWNGWQRNSTGEPLPLPEDYEMSLFRWSQMGVPLRVFELAIARAMKKPGLRGEHGVFQYMAGIITNMINEREIDYTVTASTAAVYTEAEYLHAWGEGYDVGAKDEAKFRDSIDHLQHHIDQTEMVYVTDPLAPGRQMLTGGVKKRATRQGHHLDKSVG